tara:strand:+ start:756 stop:896 length:141 start_codon:yes stop_codon:yes gene_type:complete
MYGGESPVIIITFNPSSFNCLTALADSSFMGSAIAIMAASLLSMPR